MQADEIEFGPIDLERDLESVLRMWSETGWWDGEDRQKEPIKQFFAANDGRSVVARIAGQVEAASHRTLGTMAYGSDSKLASISVGAVTAVTTSRIARRRQLASRVTARAVAHLADEGAAVAILGMFDQGYYERFGFGTGSPETTAWLRPGHLKVPAAYRSPERFDANKDSEELHNAVTGRFQRHGSVIIGGERMTSAGMQIDELSAIYGYRTDGEISHFAALNFHEDGHGPDRVIAWAYQNQVQCLELLRMIQEWGDQVDTVKLVEPGWMQMQDFMVQPGNDYRRSKGTNTPIRLEADAWWQARILDLPSCVAALAVNTAANQSSDWGTELVVGISDPITPHLEGSGYEGEWAGLAGNWRLTFGPEPAAVKEAETTATDLETSINALSRWWLGVLPASTLHAMGEFRCSYEVAESLDRLTIGLPKPTPGWDF